MPSRPTLTRAASRVPSSFFAALKMMILAPGFSSDLSPATNVTIGVSGGTTTFFSPSLYLTRILAVDSRDRLGDGGIGHGAVRAEIPGPETFGHAALGLGENLN